MEIHVDLSVMEGLVAVKLQFTVPGAEAGEKLVRAALYDIERQARGICRMEKEARIVKDAGVSSAGDR